MRYLVFFFNIMFFFFISCGLDSDDNCQNCKPLNEGAYIKAFAKLGNLANADVKIFKVLDDGSLVLYDEVITSSGDSLEEIGIFGIKADGIQDNDLFLIQISGGLDWDANDDGIKDENPTENKGTIRGFVFGTTLKNFDGQLVISPVSEIVYEFVLKDFVYSFDKKNFKEALNEASRRLLSTDINGDGLISNTDIVLFDPSRHKSFLKEDIKSSWNSIVSEIYNNSKYPIALDFGIDPVGYISSGLSYRVKIKGNTLFLGAPQGLYVYDISNIEKPKIIYSYRQNTDWFWNIYLKDNLLFAANLSDGFRIFDISDPNSLSLILSFYPLSFNEDEFPDAENVFSSQNLLVTANGVHGFSILDISDPQHPINLVTYKPCNNVKDAVLKDDFVYLLCDKQGLKVYQISSMEEVFSYQISRELSDLEIYGNKLAVAELEGKVYLFDISQPGSPVLTKTLVWADDFIFSLCIENEILFIPLYYKGVSIVDISDINNPKEEAVMKVEGNVYSVDYKNGILSVGTRNGVHIFDLNMFKNF